MTWQGDTSAPADPPLIHFPQRRALAPLACLRACARGAVAPSGLLRSPVVTRGCVPQPLLGPWPPPPMPWRRPGFTIAGGRRQRDRYRRGLRGGLLPRLPPRQRPGRDRAPLAPGQHRRRGGGERDRPAAGRGRGALPLPRPGRRRRPAQRAHGPAAGGGGPRGLPGALARRAARRARPALHADRDGDRPGAAGDAHHRGSRPPGDRGPVERVRGAAPLARRDTAGAR